MKRIAIANGLERMTLVHKDANGKVHFTYYSWWCDGADWYSRASWLGTNVGGKYETQEYVLKHGSAQALRSSLSFEAERIVPL